MRLQKQKNELAIYYDNLVFEPKKTLLALLRFPKERPGRVVQSLVKITQG